MCGRATSDSPRAEMYEVPRSSVFAVSEYTPFEERTYPSSSRVSRRRRTVGRARPVRVATSLTDISIARGPKARITSMPRANASTKSLDPSRPIVTSRVSNRDAPPQRKDRHVCRT